MKEAVLRPNRRPQKGGAKRPFYVAVAANLLRSAGHAHAVFRYATGAWMIISGALHAAELTGSVRIAAA
jgi:hypothetical protein